MKKWFGKMWFRFTVWWAMDATDIQKGMVISFASIVALFIVGSIIGGSQ